MQTAESVCLWNYQFKNGHPKSSSSSSSTSFNRVSPSKLPIDASPYLPCAERLACQDEMSSKALIYCLQCKTLQCSACDQDLHPSSTTKAHERILLNEIDGEVCARDRRHRAIFYCSTCEEMFCFMCYDNEHQHSDGREHHLEKSPPGQEKISRPIEIVAPTPLSKPSSHSFEDVHVDEQTHQAPQRLICNEQMLLESMLDDPSQTKKDLRGFLLIDGNEEMKVHSEAEFCEKLRTDEDLLVQTVSIIGNTGDGKSFTLNQVFFQGEEVFQTSTSSDSCTMGIWSALDPTGRTLLFDTEGRLGLTSNDQIRNRLLFKILSISDLIIYRTRASKLPNDMFQFLSDASNIFIKYTRNELEQVTKERHRGPALIIFHETQHTGTLKEDFQHQRTAHGQLKERFQRMNLSYEAFRSIEYVGVQSSERHRSDLTSIKATINAVLDECRSRRRLSVIFKSLKILNEKFNQNISSSFSASVADEFFSCPAQCNACGAKCQLAVQHEKDDRPHQCERRCLYNKDFDNEVWKCLQCQRQGRDTIVYGKLITKNDNLVQGLLKYVWSGCVIECPYHGEIYRSRKHWYGNNEPKDVTVMEVIHVWPGEDQSRLVSDVTPRKFMELIVYASSYLSAPTKMISELVADQMAPSYWVPNKDVIACTSCKLHFGSEYSKHHCRACGHVFCDTCTSHRRVVPWIDGEQRVRVCNACYGQPKSRPSSSIDIQQKPSTQKLSPEQGSSGDSTSTVSSGEHLNDLCLSPTDIFDIEQPGAGPVLVDIPTTRRVYETVKSGLEKIGVHYPIELIKESTRPSYWRPDAECTACWLCKKPFNSTTNRLHHCRNCGDGVCENCSPTQRPVPERDWLTPVRVCKWCDETMNHCKSKA